MRSIVIHSAALQFMSPFEELSSEQWRHLLRAHASPQNGFARGLGPVGNSAGASPFTVIPPHHQRFAHWCLRFRRRQRCLNDLCVHLIFGARALLGLEQAG